MRVDDETRAAAGSRITGQPTSPQETLAALEGGVALRWWQTTAFLAVSGDDAVTLLDGLCTQAVDRIEPGTARPGLFLDAKAKIIAAVHLHRLRGEREDAPRLLLETLPGLVEPLRAHLSRYRLRAKATIEPVELATVALTGARTPAEPPSSPSWEGGTWTWSRVEGQSHPTTAWIGEPDDAARVIDLIASELGVPLAAPDALEAARIDAGIAGLHDMLAGRMPAEVGAMDAAVALDAGCYLGQEPVIRLHYRGRANRTLRRLASDGAPDEAAIALGASASLDLQRAEAGEGRAPGRITTWARHPDGRTVALAMLRREIERGEHLHLVDGASPALVVADDAPV